MLYSSINLDAPGKQGYSQVPYSHNLGGWANVMIPMTVLSNGAGPTVLVLGAIKLRPQKIFFRREPSFDRFGSLFVSFSDDEIFPQKDSHRILAPEIKKAVKRKKIGNWHFVRCAIFGLFVPQFHQPREIVAGRRSC